jgi:hypothetical protein
MFDLEPVATVMSHTAVDTRSRGGNVMTPMTPCYRHAREVWIAGCLDCTTWHLTAARARRAEVVAMSSVARARPALPPAAPVPPIVLLHAA